MRLLLDTHTILWFYGGNSKRLSDAAYRAMVDEENDLVVTAASFWEMAIKIGLGKLRLPGPPQDLLQLLRDHGASVLNITPEHGLAVSDLPSVPNHRDPFDRLLIAQAMSEGLVLVSRESVFDQYPVQRLW